MSLLLALSLGLAAPEVQAAEDNYEFGLEGFYRARWHAFNGLYTDTPNGRYTTHKLQLRPSLDFEDRAKFFMTFTGLENVVWGDNNDVASTALFAGNPSNTTLDGTELEDVFALRQAWVEFKVPVGLLRVGRQSSHWGMGLLANDGYGFDDTFGENQDLTSFDRVIFATQPIAIVEAILSKPASGIPLFFAVGVDRLVEDPLTQYYGYECDPEVDDADVRCGQDDDHGYTEERDPTDRDDDWWAQHGDDVIEILYVLIYRGEGLEWGPSAADLTAGTYVINRVQKESNSQVWIADAYVNLAWSKLLVEGEALVIKGSTEAIAIPGAINYEEGASPLGKTANIFGGVARVGYQSQDWTAIMELGRASGDDNVGDAEFSVRALHPNHNVGLILYDEIMSRVTRYTWTDAADGLWSGGGVYNSKYIFPNVRYRPLDNWELIAAWLVAWPDQPDGARIRFDEDATSDIIGMEWDLAVKHRWHDHMLWSFEGGLARVTDRIPYENLGLTEDGQVWTLQSRLAYEF